ncbi:hypothetical protein H4R34_001827 [Dimargaris verticillata]|uniref:Uncharacterized protein n=1 Tax=Dimargaris verticillata TaxID=2761393 RepID=A0A9W8B5D2_9FUNG|nr:hypothetical protein H4R34_001827 [Dimargaris verticillata]
MVNASPFTVDRPPPGGVETNYSPLANLEAFRRFATTLPPKNPPICGANVACTIQLALIQSSDATASAEKQLAHLLTFVKHEFLGYTAVIRQGTRATQYLDYRTLVQQPEHHPLLSVTHSKPKSLIAELYLKRLFGLVRQFNVGKTRRVDIANDQFDRVVSRDNSASVVNRTLRSGVVHAFAYIALPRYLIYGAIKDQQVDLIDRLLTVVYGVLPVRSLIIIETLLLVAQAQPNGFQKLLVTWRPAVNNNLVLSCATALGFDQGHQALTTLWQVEAPKFPTVAMGCHFFHRSAEFAQVITPSQPLLIPVSN